MSQCKGSQPIQSIIRLIFNRISHCKPMHTIFYFFFIFSFSYFSDVVLCDTVFTHICWLCIFRWTTSVLSRIPFFCAWQKCHRRWKINEKKKHVSIKHHQKWWQQQIQRKRKREIYSTMRDVVLYICIAIFYHRRSQHVAVEKLIRQLVNRHARDIHFTNQLHIVDRCACVYTYAVCIDAPVCVFMCTVAHHTYTRFTHTKIRLCISFVYWYTVWWKSCSAFGSQHYSTTTVDECLVSSFSTVSSWALAHTMTVFE